MDVRRKLNKHTGKLSYTIYKFTDNMTKFTNLEES